MDVTGNGVLLEYNAECKFAYLKEAPTTGRQNHATITSAKGSKLKINQKLFACFNGEGETNSHIYVYKHTNAPTDNTPVVAVLKGMGHDTRDITVLFVNGNLTHQKLWSGYFGTKFKI
jgi:hypothetical protein